MLANYVASGYKHPNLRKKLFLLWIAEPLDSSKSKFCKDRYHLELRSAHVTAFLVSLYQFTISTMFAVT